MFLFVFALSEGARYGWFRPLEPFSVAGAEVWPSQLDVSVVPVVTVIALAVLFAFYKLERWKERTDRDPLFEFGQLRHRGFRYGLVTTSVLAMGQFGVLFVVPIFLQDAKGLSAETNGFWMLPLGVCIIIGSQLGGWLTRRISVARVVQLGLVLEFVGLVIMAFVLDPGMHFVDLLLPYGLFGFGIGFASSQLTNVILSDIPAEKSGVASGTNTTVRQVGAALGVAVIGSVFASLTVSRTVDAVKSARLPSALREAAVAGVHAKGASFPVPHSASAGRRRGARPRAVQRHHRRGAAGTPARGGVRADRRVPVVAAAAHAARAGCARAARRDPRRARARRTRSVGGAHARPRIRSTLISMATRSGFGRGSW